MESTNPTKGGNETMTPNRTIRRLAAGALVLLLAASAMGQEFDLAGLAPFAPANLSPYGGGPRPHEGFFFTFDELYWNIQRADTAIIGASQGRRAVTNSSAITGAAAAPFYEIDAIIQNTNLDTGALGNATQWGERIEFGRVYEHNGWQFSYYSIRRFNQQFNMPNVEMSFIDPAIYVDPFQPDPNARYAGPPRTNDLHGLLYGLVRLRAIAGFPVTVFDDLPVIFTNVSVTNTIDTWGVQLEYLRRTHPLHYGAYMEWFFGGRYLQFDETFDVQASVRSGAEANLVNILGGTRMLTQAQNHIVGPQIGLRIFRQTGRFEFSAEGRGTAGFNSQSFHQAGQFLVIRPDNATIGSMAVWSGNVINNTMHIDEFSPIVELRAQVRYTLTRNINFHAGWTGTWMDGIARASNIIHYEIPHLGFDPTRNRQDLLMHGLNVGIDINR